MTTYACCIGIDHYPGVEPLDYAAEDAKAIYRAVTDAQRGSARLESARLLVGREATSRRLVHELTELVRSCEIDDLLLLYFAGHAKRVEGSTYLLCDGDDPVEVEAFPLGFRPLESLVDWVGAHCRGTSLFIVDACEVGVPATFPVDRASSLQRLAQQAGVVLLYSSDLDGAARESAALGHGLLTAAILARFESGPGSGPQQSVTVRDLIQTAGSAFTAFNVLADPPVVRFTSTSLASALVETSSIERTTGRSLDLAHALDDSLTWVEEIADVCERARTARVAIVEQERHRGVLRGLAQSFRLQSAHLVNASVSENRLPRMELVGLPDGSDADLADARHLMQAAANSFADMVFNDRLWSRTRVGVRTTIEVGSDSIDVVAIPLDPRPHSRFVFLYDDGAAPEVIRTDSFARALAAGLRAAEQRRERDGVLAASLDALRDVVGFVPDSLYRRRIELFSSDVQSIVPYFQPFVSLSGNHHIEGFEALARTRASFNGVDPAGTRPPAIDPETGSAREPGAPEEIFRVADRWGRQFKTRLDLHVAHAAIEQFARETFDPDRASYPFTLSLNCFVDSLIDTRFGDELASILKDTRFPGRRLSIEISERANLARMGGDYLATESYSGLREFRQCLRDLAERLDVQFSIDDFGVDRANISRVLGLNIAYVKVDKAIVSGSRRAALLTFDYLYDLVYPLGSSPMLVAEGWDSSCELTLADLRASKCHAVQGFGTGRPRPTVPLAIIDANSRGLGPGLDPSAVPA